MRDTDKAFPVRRRWDSESGGYDLDDSGMTLSQYAAIHLKVPMSGDPELDKMIRKNRRAEFMMRALASDSLKGVANPENIAMQARAITDSMLAEWEKEARDEKGD